MKRTAFLDNLRILLTALVVFHHTAITYGGEGGWYWREVTNHGDLPLSSKMLTLFCAVNQSYFMGFFFLVAGYFTPLSYDKKGAGRFLGERLIRLGIPMLIYGFIIGPVTIAITDTSEGEPFWGALLSLWRRATFNIGPLWFAEALLIFALVYIAFRAIRPPKVEESMKPLLPLPGNLALLLSALGVGAGAFLLRLWMPTGHEIFRLQIGFFSSYIFLFAVGCVAWRGRWLERVEITRYWPWLVISALMVPVLPIALALAGGLEGFGGGWNPLAALYAFWEPFEAWGFILGLLWLFRTRFNEPTPFSRWLAERAYAVYIVHPPVLVSVSLALRFWAAPPLLKFVTTGSLACAGCLLIAALLLAIPGGRKIL